MPCNLDGRLHPSVIIRALPFAFFAFLLGGQERDSRSQKLRLRPQTFGL